MKNFLPVICAYLFMINISAQDVIVRTNGTLLNGKIVSEDSTSVYVSTKVNNKTVDTYIKKDEIKEIIYGEQSDDVALNKVTGQPYSNTAITIGVLQGGGSLLGIDCEFLLYKNLGFQVGFGAMGYGAGLNIHFKPTTQSSFISLMYWHQGFGDNFTQSLIGPAYVFRARKLFTAQLGIAKTLEEGPSYPDNMEFPPVMLTYAIGIYIPW